MTDISAMGPKELILKISNKDVDKGGAKGAEAHSPSFGSSYLIVLLYIVFWVENIQLFAYTGTHLTISPTLTNLSTPLSKLACSQFRCLLCCENNHCKNSIDNYDSKMKNRHKHDTIYH